MSRPPSSAAPVAFRYFFHTPTVAGVCPIQNPFVIITQCIGFSSSPHSLSPGEHPISKLPGGIQT
jgi:hypothetical protein